MRGTVVAVVCAVVAAISVPSGVTARVGRRDATTSTVTVANNAFKPSLVRTLSGRVVTWRWVGGVPHNVVGLNYRGRKIFASATTARAGYHYSYRFRRRGIFTVICSIHPDTMRMYVRVR